MAARHRTEENPELEGHLADKSESFDNVTRKGEQKFIDSLNAMAISGDWAGSFEDGTFISSFGFEKDLRVHSRFTLPQNGDILELHLSIIQPHLLVVKSTF